MLASWPQESSLSLFRSSGASPTCFSTSLLGPLISLVRLFFVRGLRTDPHTSCVGGAVLGIIFLATFVSSLILVPIRGTKSLIMLNWLLFINGIAILLVGTYIWFSTLHERNNYHAAFGMQSDATKIAIQDTVRSTVVSAYRSMFIVTTVEMLRLLKR